MTTTTDAENLSSKPKIRKAYQVGTSTVVAIAAPLVRQLNIDEQTYFEEVVHPEGLLLKVRRLQ